ncbi:hypothetical protein [Ornithinimicrobium cerasi]|uniref:hypothetical protein n=1 Tax=Ornithinimicrobium cerasi TaxID=2248773 RepID=UPI000EFFF2AC|nr:hypothetical protein [Ornithinimicrobium cerasi]
MRVTARILRWSAAGVLLLVAVLGAVFAAGYAAQDQSVLFTTVAAAAWVVAAGALGWLALRGTGLAVPTLLAVTVAVAVVAVLDARFDLFARNTRGPVMTVAVLALFVPLALLGLRRATEAGLMLLLVGAVQLLSSGLLQSVADGEPQWGRLLAGSSGVVVIPALLGAALLLVAGRVDHDHVSFRSTPHGFRTAH